MRKLRSGSWINIRRIGFYSKNLTLMVLFLGNKLFIGKDANEVFRWLRTNSSLNDNGKCNPISWTFGKFLLDGKGEVMQYYTPKQNPLSFEDEIKKTLGV
jgi:glutathione peroxidase-family protein